MVLGLDDYLYDNDVYYNKTITKFETTDEAMFISTNVCELGAYLDLNTLEFVFCDYVKCFIKNLVLFYIANDSRMYIRSSLGTYFLGIVPPHLYNDATSYCSIANDSIRLVSV